MNLTIDVKVSECCHSEIVDGICIHCDHPCDSIIITETYFDEVKADDERQVKE